MNDVKVERKISVRRQKAVTLANINEVNKSICCCEVRIELLVLHSFLKNSAAVFLGHSVAVRL